jgi:hypothetical protein
METVEAGERYVYGAHGNGDHDVTATYHPLGEEIETVSLRVTVSTFRLPAASGIAVNGPAGGASNAQQAVQIKFGGVAFRAIEVTSVNGNLYPPAAPGRTEGSGDGIGDGGTTSNGILDGGAMTKTSPCPGGALATCVLMCPHTSQVVNSICINACVKSCVTPTAAPTYLHSSPTAAPTHVKIGTANTSSALHTYRLSIYS